MQLGRLLLFPRLVRFGRLSASDKRIMGLPIVRPPFTRLPAGFRPSDCQGPIIEVHGVRLALTECQSDVSLDDVVRRYGAKSGFKETIARLLQCGDGDLS